MKRANFLLSIGLVLPASAFGQEQEPGLRAPFSSTVMVAAAGESVRLNGIVTVQSASTTAPDGKTTVSYSCRVTAAGAGQTSGAQYVGSGDQSGASPVSAAPADVGISCAMTLVSGGVAQPFDVRLQGSVDESGKLASVLVRDVAARQP